MVVLDLLGKNHHPESRFYTAKQSSFARKHLDSMRMDRHPMHGLFTSGWYCERFGLIKDPDNVNPNEFKLSEGGGRWGI